MWLTFGVLAAYGLVILLMSWPAPTYLGRRLIGNNVDNWIFYWDNWWIEQVLTQGEHLFFSSHVYYPQGVSLVAHSLSHVHSLLAFLFKPLGGPVLAYNLTFLLGLWIGAAGTYLLVYDLTHHRLGAFVAGFVFAFAPYHLTQALAHVHLGTIHWWPFYVLFLRRALIEDRWRPAIGAGVAAALTLWSGVHLAVLLAVWTGPFVIWWLVTTASRRAWGQVLRVGGVVVLTVAVLCWPFLVSALQVADQLTGAVTHYDEGNTRQTDLLAYVVPPTYNPLVGAVTVPTYERFASNQAFMPYLGFGTLTLAAVALARRRRPASFWAISGGLWMVLAAGAAPRINGVVYEGVPLPYRFIGGLFPLSVLRAPDRFNLLVVLSLSVLAGLGAAWLHTHRRRWLLVPLALLLVLEYLCFPLPAWDLPPVSPFFEEMAADETSYGAVNYPMDYELAKVLLYYQTVHGKPVVQGHFSRYTADDYTFILSQPVLRALYRPAGRPPHLVLDEAAIARLEASTTVSALGPALRSLEAAGVRYVLLHRPHTDDLDRQIFYTILPLVPIYQDPLLAVIDVTDPRLAYIGDYPVPLVAGVELLDLTATPLDGNRWQIRALVRLSATWKRSQSCRIRLTGAGGDLAEEPMVLFDRLEEGGWQAGDLEVKQAVVSLPQPVAPGTYRWGLVCGEEPGYTLPARLEVGPGGRTSYLLRAPEVDYGETIRLTGYRWRRSGGDLQVVLSWEALDSPEADYKVFVHLVDAEGALVAQYDAMPCNWTCPTGGWRGGQMVDDRASLPLVDLPAGTYRLMVGMVDPVTGERLPARGPGGRVYPDGAAHLPDPITLSWEVE